MEPQAADNPLATRYRLRIRLIRIIVLLVSITLTSSLALFWPPSQSQTRRKHPVPYHTSILSGAAWVAELLTGHPERIRCELGMHREVFIELVDTLRRMGHGNSKYVSLEEQLAIFLYTCVTGLTIRHVGERFQRSNETISRCVPEFSLVASLLIIL
jgi:hypothetical protein